MDNVLVPSVLEGFWMLVFSALVLAAVIAIIVWGLKKPGVRRTKARSTQLGEHRPRT
jgi:ABC-type transporter Mla subunit MlaD